ncbi:hypothetical protein BGX34_011367 [Mortierella sp. NVP85]|nr:hypothetical protein BGX34_011367 [Mortierella sp. NVP85]
MLTHHTWRQDLKGLYAEPYLNSCARPEDFEYISFLMWMKKENLGKGKARTEWRNAIAQMERSEFQILTKNPQKDLENEHFSNWITKRKLENNRQTLHQAVDSVLTKRSRLEYRVEEETLDSALSSENHVTRDEIEQEEQGDQREQNEQDEQEDQCDQDEQRDHDQETNQEQLNKSELEELRANLAEVTHDECDA